ncbi:MAG TPA: polysaccharide deacetylase family protein, partial [Sphingobium sp.]
MRRLSRSSNEKMQRPIFYDASGRRRRLTLPAISFALIAILIAAIAFAVTILDVPVPAAVPLRMERPRPEGIGQRLGRLGASLRGELAGWLPHRGRAMAVRPVNVAFYVPWDDASKASLRQHVAKIDWVAPTLISVTGRTHVLHVTADPVFASIIRTAHRRPRVMPVVQNVADGDWDGAGAAALLHSRAARTIFLERLLPALATLHASGVVFDLEALPKSAQPDYLAFLRQAAPLLHDHHLQLMLTAPAEDADWNLRAYGRAVDRLFLMDYDQHYVGQDAGPIAAQPWFVQRLRAALQVVPASKVIVAIGNYAYDWTEGGGVADARSIEDAWLSAHYSGAPIRFDPASGNATFDYQEEGKVHHVWMLDAASAWNQIRAARLSGVGGMALWRLGSEDPGFWHALTTRTAVPPSGMNRLTSFNSVDVEGNGEILRIDDVPTIGRREIRMGSGENKGLIADERFASLPTPYVIRRTGYRPHLVALTFDDGPDATWTPPILDILKAAHVPATFFVIGENA